MFIHHGRALLNDPEKAIADAKSIYKGRIIVLNDGDKVSIWIQYIVWQHRLQETLVRHEKSKPAEVCRPEPKEEDKEYQEALTSINEQITARKQNCDSINDRITELTSWAVIASENAKRWEIR